MYLHVNHQVAPRLRRALGPQRRVQPARDGRLRAHRRTGAGGSFFLLFFGRGGGADGARCAAELCVEVGVDVALPQRDGRLVGQHRAHAERRRQHARLGKRADGREVGVRARRRRRRLAHRLGLAAPQRAHHRDGGALVAVRAAHY